MDDLVKLEKLSLVSKVCTELENHLGLNDKTLAEFVIMLGKKSKDVDKFKTRLGKNGADFPDSLVMNLFRLIQKLKPSRKKDSGADIKADELPEQTFKRQKYPGLCIPDAELTAGEKIDPEDEAVATKALDELEALYQWLWLLSQQRMI